MVKFKFYNFYLSGEKSYSMKSKIFIAQALLLWVFAASFYAQQPPRKLRLSDAVASYMFYPKTVEGICSMNDGEHYTTLNAGAIVRYNYKTGLAADTLFSPAWLPEVKLGVVSDYAFSGDETKILLTSNAQPIYRRSFRAAYYVFNRETHNLISVSKNGDPQLAEFSPDGNKVAFVRDNNIYISELETGHEYAVTTDGKFNRIINGAPDWVYEEEFGFSKAFEWSPDGKHLAFMRFDESRVRLFSMTVFDSLYPTVNTFKYPKAGEDNSIVTVWVYNLADKSLHPMDIGAETNQYIPRIKWTATPGMLCILRLNRLQNTIDALFTDISTGKSKAIYTETNKYFISEVNDNFIQFTADGNYFIVFSERTGYNHLYLYGINGQLVNAVTKGDYDVTKLLSVDNVNKRLYYVSAETSPLNRDVYSIKFDGSAKKRISVGEGTTTAEFSSTHKYYILSYSNAKTPVNYTLYSNDGKLLRVLEDNASLQETIGEYNFQPKEFVSIPITNGTELNGYMIKPADFDAAKKYPLFMFVYGGPQSQEVVNSWDRSMAWYQYLVQQGYIVACVDNRGTDGRGEEFRKCTYLQLGKLELADQVNAARYFGSLSYIDSKRIGIFGWSYGGYMASLCMTKGEGVFKMGIAVAPVTNWRYYDNIYTERFMRTPQENPLGYDDNSPINFAGNLQGKFLLIHGSADDNVHLQNTMVFSEKLVQANKKFDEAIYTDKNHGINGGNTRFHLYSRMTDFILTNL
jgi:dipeptidyl-peptidase-4